MLSRVANSIYWMARYVERAENLSRFIEVTLNVILDHSAEEQWEPLVHATGDVEYYKKRYGEFTSEKVRHFLTFDRDYPNSIISSVCFARENARTVREAISSEAWETLNEFYLFVMKAEGAGIAHADSIFYSEIRKYSHLFGGIFDSTMSRDKGWYFANIGRFLERADKISRILDVKYFTLLPTVYSVGTTVDDLLWSAVLRSVSGFEMFRKRYHTITIHRIVEFLVLNTRFPRAIRYCVRTVGNSLSQVGGPAFDSNPALQLAAEIEERLATANNEEIINGGLHEFIDTLQIDLNRLGAAINDTYFGRRRSLVAEVAMHSQSSSQTLG
ncbi:MAG: alpha-E domain-containing protein [Planctomycetes bacterium]|nr:alpha-E domain-containing protein [Planctomycetota bacterium]